MSTEWFEEIDPNNNVGMKFKITEKIFSEKSPFQQVDIYKTYSHGKLLAHDGMVMITEKDEHIYHDMITHVPLFTHPNPKHILVIGGGDGGTVREVLRHSSVEKCVMVEIDPVVIKACRQHFPTTSCEFDNPKLELLIEDGLKYVSGTDNKFDVVIIDSSDPIGPATPLFNIDFYKNIDRILTEDGIVVSQCESPYYHQAMQETLVKIKKELFPKVYLYTYTNLSYPGGYWSFSFASKKHCPLKNLDHQRVADSGLDFKYYNSNIHKASFALPNFMKKMYQGLLTDIPLL